MKNEPKFQEYPKAMHGPEDGYQVVNSKEEEEALGEGWIDGHEHWAAKAAEDGEDETEDDSGSAPDKPRRGRKKKVAE